MASTLAERIQQRLTDLGISARSASIQAGLSPAAVRSILEGRSTSPRAANLQALATVLRCDIGYLLGKSDEIGFARKPLPKLATLQLRGEAQLDRWSSGFRLLLSGQLLVPPSPDYSADQQFAVRVGDHSMGAIIPEGGYVHLVEWGAADELKPGQVVFVMRIRSGGEPLFEHSLREVGIDELGRIELRTRFQHQPLNEAITYLAPAGANSSLGREIGETVTVLGWAIRAYLHLGGEPIFQPADAQDLLAMEAASKKLRTTVDG